MAPIDIPECFAISGGFPDLNPVLIYNTCSGFIYLDGQRYLALDDIPRYYPIVPTLDPGSFLSLLERRRVTEPVYPITDPYRFKIYNVDKFCEVHTLIDIYS